MNLSDLIARNAAFAPEKPALRFEGETLSYAAFYARIEQAACVLETEFGVTKGDRVAILSLNRPDYLVLLYACARLGAMLVPLNWRLAVAEQLFILRDCGAKVLALGQGFAEVLLALDKNTAIRRVEFTPPGGKSFDAILASAHDESNASADLACPLLIVYTSG